ncbi:LpxL/LpxP family acyltransferase [Marinobacter orientalis]|uniref:Uncharacterized protein n=1 Tax=Marinobacter orientalis TaxID=1928859 RepID=A0A7Y0WTX6_9GAMM|nr:hypothetical protein [Marinobacter orientalis]NMT65306.1 hypothetical protein [Marinobacter orientalis]TGX47925.1 hypothetical protein DIT72_17055 [Marinobacter orientalis]
MCAFGQYFIAHRGIVRLLSILRKGGVAGILPDQAPGREDREPAQFFGVQATTMAQTPHIL